MTTKLWAGATAGVVTLALALMVTTLLPTTTAQGSNMYYLLELTPRPMNYQAAVAHCQSRDMRLSLTLSESRPQYAIAFFRRERNNIRNPTGLWGGRPKTSASCPAVTLFQDQGAFIVNFVGPENCLRLLEGVICEGSTPPVGNCSRTCWSSRG